MKFGKQLKIHLEETLPEWRDKFVAYKQLKKRLKLLKSAPDCFAEVAFIPAAEGGDSEVAKVDSMLRNGSEIGHYENGLRLRSIRGYPGVVEEKESERRSAAGSGVGTVEGVVAGEEEEVRSREPEGVEVEEGDRVRKGKRKWESDGEEEEEFDTRTFTSDQMEFVSLLNVELEKFNSFFIEKEEEYVIRLQELKERIERMKESTAQKSRLSEDDVTEMTTIYTEMIRFHGEMVLLETYSSLNYTGLVKILKKHDKLTGGVLRTPFIRTVLHQPFYTTELLSQLVKDCELNLSNLFPIPVQRLVAARPAEQATESSSAANTSDSESGVHRAHSPPSEEGGSSEQRNGSGGAFAAPGDNLDGVYRSAVAALKTIKDIRRGSSTYSPLSMPPLELPDGDDSLGVVINEQLLRDASPSCRTSAVSLIRE